MNQYSVLDLETHEPLDDFNSTAGNLSKASCTSKGTLPPFENIISLSNSKVNEHLSKENTKDTAKESCILKDADYPLEYLSPSIGLPNNMSSQAANMILETKSCPVSNKSTVLSPDPDYNYNGYSNSAPDILISSGADFIQNWVELSKTKIDFDEIKNTAVLAYINSLSKAELVSILIRLLGLQLITKDPDQRTTTNTEGSDAFLTSPENEGKNADDACRKRQDRPMRKRVAVSKEKFEHSAKPLKKRSSRSNRLVQSETNSNALSKVDKRSGTGVHISNTHTFTCKMCDLTFPELPAYRKHLQTHAASVTCDICDKVFKSKDSLYHHQRGLHRNEKPYRCDVCDSYFSFHHSYKLHLQRHKGERPFSCDLCPKTYLTSSHLKEHVRAVHLNSSIICHICGKIFSYNSALKLHLQIHTDNQVYNCSTCNKIFYTKRALKRHSVHHFDKERVKCNVCGKYFKSDHYLNIHSKLHGNNFDRNYKCDICSKSFFYKCVLDNHVQSHSAIRSFQCTICDKTFKTKASLYSHKYVHNEGLAYCCTTCNKSFKTKGCLTAHTKRHQNQSSFVCSMCGKSFPDKGGLSKHTKTIHLPRRYYSCKICERMGTRADNMRTHVKSHRNQVGANDDPMSFISCMEEETQPTMVSSNAKIKKSKIEVKGTSDLVSKNEKTRAFARQNEIDISVDSVVLEESQPLLSTVATMSTVSGSSGQTETISNFIPERKCHNDTNKDGVSPSPVIQYNSIDTSKNNAFSHQLGIADINSSSSSMPVIGPISNQTHSSSSSSISSLNQFLPGYNRQFLPTGTVNYSAVRGGTDWLVASSSQSVSNDGDPIL